VRCIRADAVSLAYLGGTPVDDAPFGPSPLSRGDWFLRSLGIVIANNVMLNRFSSTATVPAGRHRESSEAQGDSRILTWNRAATWSRIRTETPHLFDVNTENLGYAPSLSNTSARTMGRLTFEDLRDMT
jgi:hypothetical protein